LLECLKLSAVDVEALSRMPMLAQLSCVSMEDVEQLSSSSFPLSALAQLARAPSLRRVVVCVTTALGVDRLLEDDLGELPEAAVPGKAEDLGAAVAALFSTGWRGTLVLDNMSRVRSGVPISISISNMSYLRTPQREAFDAAMPTPEAVGMAERVVLREYVRGDEGGPF
jgi:hypothetical protein